jgi:hypothetical protein
MEIKFQQYGFSKNNSEMAKYVFLNLTSTGNETENKYIH